MSPETTLFLKLAMLSDWHVGTGAGRPYDVDRLIARDSSGLPYIPAKTITGIWRDACERVSLGLDNGEEGFWSNWVTALFGDEPNRTGSKPGHDWAAPVAALLSIRPARLPIELRARLSSAQIASDAAIGEGSSPLRAAVTFVKPGVMIDPDTGGAREDFLRMEEMARGGIELTAEATLETNDMDEEQKRTAEALLVAGAALIERLGGKRRRGHGRCHATLRGLALIDALGFIEKSTLKQSPPVRRMPDTVPIVSSLTIDDTWYRLPLTLDLLSPVVAQSSTVGNVVESLDYIPGSLILPIVARALRLIDSSVDEEIARGNLVVLSATIDVANERGLPTPMSFLVPKNDSNLDNAINGLIEADDGQQQRRPFRGRFLAPSEQDDQYPVLSRVDLIVNSHSTIDELKQRPTADVGGVFSYQALPAGLTLRSEIRLRGGLLARLNKEGAWWSRLTGDIRVGRSKKDDYGHVRMTACEKGPIAFPLSAGDKQDTSTLLVWLLSDLLIRNGSLRTDTILNSIREVLARELAPTISISMANSAAPGLISAELRTRRYDSWHTNWGLPRPSLVAVQAGSCFRISLSQPITAETIHAIEVRGLGERRAEGFGQIAINHSLLTRPLRGRHQQYATPSVASGPASSIAEHHSAHGTAAMIEKAAWREAIKEVALSIGFDAGRREKTLGFTKSKPGRSQLGSLRSKILRIGGSGTDHKAFRQWLDNLKKQRPDSWPQQSFDCLDRLLSNKDQVWADLNISMDTLTRNGEKRLKDELWSTAVIALVSASIRGQTLDLAPGDQ